MWENYWQIGFNLTQKAYQETTKKRLSAQNQNKTTMETSKALYNLFDIYGNHSTVSISLSVIATWVEM